MIDRPHRWSLPVIRRFMLCFGRVRSLFDDLTFVVLLGLLRADPAQFRPGWFVEFVWSASLIVLVIRCRGPVLRSQPSRGLILATVVVVVITLALPATDLGRLAGILLAYGTIAELVKRPLQRLESQRERGVASAPLPGERPPDC